MRLLRWLLLFLFMPCFCFGQDSTPFIQNLINTGGTLPTGAYNVTTLVATHSFNFNGSTLNAINNSGQVINCTTSGVTIQNVGIHGLGGTYSSTGLTGVTINTTNIVLANVSVSNVSNYGIVGGAYSNETIINCSVFNSGNVGISMITNTSAVTGITVTGCSINRSPQGAAVYQSCLMVRNNALPGGSMTGSVITNNVLTQATVPSTNPNGECFEMRNNVNAFVNNNSYSGGSIGFSMVGCTGTRSPNGNYSGQSIEAMEFINCTNSSMGTGTGAVTSGVVGFLVDPSVTMLGDTITKSTLSGLTSFPVLVNTIASLQLLIDSMTASTTTNAIVMKGASGVTLNHSTFTGNNTTYAIQFNNSPGGLYGVKDAFINFQPKIAIAVVTGTTSSITTNNVVMNQITPTTPSGFLSIQANTGVTLGSNICFNCLPLPPVPAYSPASYTFNTGVAITPVVPTNTGGSSTSWSISPALPSGLLFNTSNGTISGTPIAASSATTYTVTATNTGGSASTPISITVINNPPAISYTPASQICTQGVAMTAMNPNNTGGAATSWSVSPALPPGINLNTSTGAITGTPTSITPTGNYVVTATNSGGSSHFTVTLTVNAAKPHIAYSPTSQSYFQNSPIVPWTPTNTGGASTWTITPSAPVGLVFNTTTGQITGTPLIVQGNTSYKVKATNTGGADSTIIQITVKVALPAISYSPNSNTYLTGTMITPLSPIVTGGAVVSYAITPSLPSGLSFNTSTGVISGTPTVASPSISYTITATNASGSGQTTISIQVNPTAPNIAYTPDTLNYTQFISTVPITPSNSGGQASYSISPTLPSGLLFDTTTGTLYGTPLLASPATNYLVTATNISGSSSATLNITVIGNIINVIRVKGRTGIIVFP